MEISIYAYLHLSEQVARIGLVVLTERIVKEKYFMYLKIIIRKVKQEDDQNTDGGIVYQQILVNAK